MVGALLTRVTSSMTDVLLDALPSHHWAFRVITLTCALSNGPPWQLE